MADTSKSKYLKFKTKNAVARGVPEQGFCISTGAGYDMCTRQLSSAMRGAQLLANAEGRRVDVIRVAHRGADRDTIAEVFPASRKR